MNIITHRLKHLDGDIDLETLQLASVSNRKHLTVGLGLKLSSGGKYQFAEIKLHSSDRAKDAEPVFDGAVKLAELIAERFNQAEQTPDWQTLEDFQKVANEGWCWIIFSGRERLAYHDEDQIFREKPGWGATILMSKCITHAMPIYPPAKPDGI